MALRRPKRSISGQLAASIMLIVAALVVAVSIAVSLLLTGNYERHIKFEIVRASASIQQAVFWFVDGACNLSFELAVNPSVLTMDGAVQTPIIENCVTRNDYLDLLFIQGSNGLLTARSDGGGLRDHSGSWWFNGMMEKRRPFVSGSYYSGKTKRPCASIFIPMHVGDSLVGVLGANIKLGHFQKLIDRVSDRKEGRYSFIVDGDGVVLAHPDGEFLEALVNIRKRTRVVPQRNRAGNVMVDAGGNVITSEVPYPVSEDYAAILKRAMDGESGTGLINDDGIAYYVSYAPISLPGVSEPWMVVTLQDRAVAMNVVAAMIRDIVLIALVMAVAAVLLFMYIIGNKISRPVNALTVAAGKISHGKLDTEIPTLGAEPGDGDEIAVLSAALNRMVEQLRVHAAAQARAQAVTAVKLQFGLFVKEASSIPQAVKMAVAVLRYQYDPLKITAVYANPNPAYALICAKNGEKWSAAEADNYPHHAEITAMLADKRLMFLNSFTIMERGAGFADEATQFACAVPLASKGSGKRTGYIIIECEDRTGLSVVREESFLLRCADELSSWIFEHKQSQLSAPAAVGNDAGTGGVDGGSAGGVDAGAAAQPKSRGALSALREFEDLDVDSAVEAMGGLEDLYERSVRLFAKLLPDTIAKMDDYLGGDDLKAFAVEIHGVKGSLNNIGAALGHRAAWIEKAAKFGDAAYCEDSYPRFKELLYDLHNRLLDALPGQVSAAKPAGDINSIVGRLDRVKELSATFDALEARKIVQDIAEFSYNPDADAIIRDIASALERFDCENASQLTDKLKGSLP